MRVVFVYASCIFLAASQSVLVSSKLETGNGQLFLNKYPIPKKTPDPINIDTKKVHQLKLPPLHLTGVIFVLTNLSNTGKSVDANIIQPFTLAGATGGVLGSEKYQFFEIKYFWTNDLNGGSGNSLDGEQFPFETRVYFKNRKYLTKREALKHRDGFAVLTIPFSICHIPNILYNGLGTKLRQIQQPGFSTLIFLGTLILAVDFIPVNSTYYGYPGSYIDDVTGKRYSCATIMYIKPNPKLCFTKEQFKSTFGALKSSFGGPLTSTLSQYPAVMPIVETNGVTQTILPIF